MIKILWNNYKAGILSQLDYELSYLNYMINSISENILDMNFFLTFEEILFKLSDKESLSEYEWECVQRLYFIKGLTFSIEDLKDVFEQSNEIQ